MNDLRADCPMRHENGNCLVAGGFCTAVNDQICEALHNAYECGFYDATYERREKRESLKSRKVQKYSDTKNVWTYFIPNERCSCGANCYHYEYDGEKIFGVCNACGQCIGEVKPEYIQEYLDNGIWE